MNRAQALKLVHVARRDLSMDDAAWRDLLRQKFGVESSKDLDISGLYRLIEHLKHCGFRVRHAVSKAPGAGGHKSAGAPARSRPLAGAAQESPGEAAKIRALWLFLAELGLVRNRSEAALAAYVKRVTGVDALQWLDGSQTAMIIETLKRWALRVLPNRASERYHRVKALPAVPPQRLGEVVFAASRCKDRRVNFDAWRDLYEAAGRALEARP
jgi:phage gp16-like protein